MNPTKTISLLLSTISLILYCCSYFFNSKKKYLTFQVIGNIFLSFSYCFMEAYFTMISVIIGIGRGLICYAYEKNNRKVPLLVVVGLCVATVASYILINYVILAGAASPWDILYLLASCLYAITFAMRNMKRMRYVILIPHTSAIVYNLLVKAPISSAMSYGIELVITVVAIIKFHLQERHTKI